MFIKFTLCSNADAFRFAAIFLWILMEFTQSGRNECARRSNTFWSIKKVSKRYQLTQSSLSHIHKYTRTQTFTKYARKYRWDLIKIKMSTRTKFKFCNRFIFVFTICVNQRIEHDRKCCTIFKRRARDRVREQGETRLMSWFWWFQ